MSVELRNLKGTCDFMPSEQRMRNEISRRLKEVFEIYGYQPLETPVMCYFDILASKYSGGAEILKEVYRFKDQGQRDIGLRYDLTVPFARFIGMNPQKKMPFKRYEIGKVFRNGPVKLGRNREFIQCDVDMVGVKSVMAEAELMIMAKDVFEMLELDVYIPYNNRKLLSGIITSAGIPEEIQNSVILSLDKIEKIGLNSVGEELLDKGVEAYKIDKLFSLLNMDGRQLLDQLRANPENELIIEGIKELDELTGYLASSGINDKCRFSPWLSRGLEIYTGTVFEVFLVDETITSSLGAGGRYDNIIGAFLDNSIEYPAVGMTFGLDVIYTALYLKNKITQEPPVKLYIIPIGTSAAAMNLTTSLRRKGIAVDIQMNNWKVKKGLEYASKLGIPYVIILGEDELKSQRVKIKDMARGIDIDAGIDEIASLV